MKADTDKEHSLKGRERRIAFSPWRLALILGLGIFIIDRLVIEFIRVLPPLSPEAENLLDSFVTSLCLFPLLYIYAFKPMLHLITECRINEEQLQTYHDQLEQTVEGRTHELNTVVRRLEQEIAERQKVEDALRESEERSRQLFEQSEDAIVLISTTNDAVADLNPAAEKVFGRTSEELMAGGIAGLCAREKTPLLSAAIEAIKEERISGAIDRLTMRDANGEERILSFRGKLIRLHGEKFIYTTFRDITTRIRMEEHAREMQARLIHINRMTSLGTLVSSVAHEINNPNNYILINAGLLKQAWEDIDPLLETHYQREGDFKIGQSTYGKVRQFLPDAFEGIMQGARRISDLVDNLKDFGRDDRTGREELADINAVVRLSASILNHYISRSTRRFGLDLADGLPPVRGSARQLEQVVINLIQNALQALPDADHGVRVATSLDEDGTNVVIQVMDEGSGIPEEIADHIMEPFYTTRLEEGGTGLGLAICSAIVREHGGHIDFNSKPGVGTTFTVHLLAGDARTARNSIQSLEVSNA